MGGRAIPTEATPISGHVPAATLGGVGLTRRDDLAVLGLEDEVELSAVLVADDELAGGVSLLDR
jgi:hypothetical protein